MSFFSDPKLFLSIGRGMCIVTVPTKPGCPFRAEDNSYLYYESDFESLFEYLSRNNKLVNCQGIVINYFPKGTGTEYSWSPEGINLSSYGIYALKSEADAHKNEQDRDEKLQALEKRVSDLLVQLNQEKKQVVDLTSKLEKCWGCGAKGGSVDEEEHWMTGRTVPSNLVPFEELDVLTTFPRNTPLTITRVRTPTMPVTGEDMSTNVKVSRFYGGVFPMVIVNVDELSPDKENAKFDPDIWGLFQNKGTSYAARKLLMSETLVLTLCRPRRLFRRLNIPRLSKSAIK